MRVLFTTTGHSGHLLPLVPLARACERAGHVVAFATRASHVEAAQRLGLSTHGFEEAPKEAWAPLMDRLATLCQPDADAFIIREGFARIGAGAALPGVLRLLARWRPDVVVHESYEFAGPLAARHLGIPTARVALGLASTEEWVARLAAPAVADLRREHGLDGASEAGHVAGRSAARSEARRRRPAPDAGSHSGDLLFSAVPPALDDGPAVRFPAAAPRVAPPLPAWWEDVRDPLVYLTFGSVSGSLPLFPALYRSALDALASLPARVLVTVGRDAELAALGPLPANVHAEPWVDQDEILPHAAAVVGHGGYGTTLGALSHGVPLVMLPLFAGDQWRTARRVAQVGAGVMVEDGERRVMDPPGPRLMAFLPHAVQRLLRDARYRRTAQRIGRGMAALPPVEAAVAALEAAVGMPADRAAAH
jgi:UDP:flavonoid glycosyltransferase YjiC (YdhE family)